MPVRYTAAMAKKNGKDKRFNVLDEQLKQRGLTQKEVAAAAGHDVGWYHQVRNFEIDPSWTDMAAMAAKVGISLDCLVGLTCRAGAVPWERVELDRQKLLEEKARKQAMRKKALRMPEKIGGFSQGKKR